MSITKRMLEDEELKRQVAVAISVRAKALSSCSFHEEVYMGTGNAENAYKMGNHLYSNESWVSDAFESRKEMTDWIQLVLDDAWNDQCCRCEKLMRD